MYSGHFKMRNKDFSLKNFVILDALKQRLVNMMYCSFCSDWSFLTLRQSLKCTVKVYVLISIVKKKQEMITSKHSVDIIVIG